jgi:hypothetical protein
MAPLSLHYYLWIHLYHVLYLFSRADAKLAGFVTRVDHHTASTPAAEYGFRARRYAAPRNDDEKICRTTQKLFLTQFL